MSAPEHEPVSQQVRVTGGEVRSISLVLPRVQHTPTTLPALPPSDQRAETRPAKRRWYKSPWLWSAVGVVAAGAATGIALAATRGTGPVDTGTSGAEPLAVFE